MSINLFDVFLIALKLTRSSDEFTELDHENTQLCVSASILPGMALFMVRWTVPLPSGCRWMGAIHHSVGSIATEHWVSGADELGSPIQQ